MGCRTPGANGGILLGRGHAPVVHREHAQRHRRSKSRSQPTVFWRHIVPKLFLYFRLIFLLVTFAVVAITSASASPSTSGIRYYVVNIRKVGALDSIR